MAFRRIAVVFVLIALGAAACSGDRDDSGGISIDEPIGAPDTQDYAPASGVTSGDTATASEPSVVDPGPSVIKTASLELDVVKDKLNSAAQQIVDVATSPQVGGFLVSSVVDLDQGYGLGNVVVQVPSARFEHVVGELGDVGNVTLQHLQGQDLTPEFLSTQSRLQDVRKHTARLLTRIQGTDDKALKFELRDKLQASRNELDALEQNAGNINAQTAYSSIDVALTGTAPAAAPEKPAINRALETAKSIAIAIASGAVLTAGVVVPIGLLVLLVYVALAPVMRRFKPRLES